MFTKEKDAERETKKFLCEYELSEKQAKLALINQELVTLETEVYELSHLRSGRKVYKKSANIYFLSQQNKTHSLSLKELNTKKEQRKELSRSIETLQQQIDKFNIF